MAECDGYRIGSVGSHPVAFETEQCLNHELHLLFRRIAVADDGFFHLPGRIFRRRQSALHCGKEADTPGMTEFQRRLRVFSVECALDGEFIGAVLREYMAEPCIDRVKTFGDTAEGRVGDRAGSKEPDCRPPPGDDTEPGHQSARINAEHHCVFESRSSGVSC